MDKKICKEFRAAEKRLKIKSLGPDIHNEILGFILPCKVGDLWSGGTWRGRDMSYMMVTRCTPDKVWLKDVRWDRDAKTWIDDPYSRNPGKSTRRTLSFQTFQDPSVQDQLTVTIGVRVYEPHVGPIRNYR